MPTYEYRCEACGHEFEKFQSITDSAVRKCPRCGRLKVRRLISAGGGIIFKGSGFYGTDYRSESYRKAEKEEKDGAETKPGDKDEKGDKKKDKKKDEKTGAEKKEDKK